jgi:hypothetical protein
MALASDSDPKAGSAGTLERLFGGETGTGFTGIFRDFETKLSA